MKLRSIASRPVRLLYNIKVLFVPNECIQSTSRTRCSCEGHALPGLHDKVEMQALISAIEESKLP